MNANVVNIHPFCDDIQLEIQNGKLLWKKKEIKNSSFVQLDPSHSLSDFVTLIEASFRFVGFFGSLQIQTKQDIDVPTLLQHIYSSPLEQQPVQVIWMIEADREEKILFRGLPPSCHTYGDLFGKFCPFQVSWSRFADFDSFLDKKDEFPFHHTKEKYYEYPERFRFFIQGLTKEKTLLPPDPYLIQIPKTIYLGFWWEDKFTKNYQF